MQGWLNLVHVLPLLGRHARDDAVVGGDANPTIVRQLEHLGGAIHRNAGTADARDRALQGVLIPTYIPHQSRIVRRHPCGRLHIADVLEVEVVDADPAQVAQSLQRHPERPGLRLRAQRWA